MTLVKPLALFAAAVAGAAHASPPLVIPPAPKEPFSETVFGHRMDDPYRWMEDAAEAPRLREWMSAVGTATAQELRALPERGVFLDLLQAASKAGVVYSDAQSAKSRVFALRRDPGAAVPKLIVRGENGQDLVLLDPATGAENGTEGASGTRAIASYAPSPDGSLVAVMVGQGGGELGNFAILDAATGAERTRLTGQTFGDFELSWLAQDLVSYTRVGAGAGSGKDPLIDMQAMVVELRDGGATEHLVLGNQFGGGPAFAPQEFPLILPAGDTGLALGLAVGARADARLMVARLDDLRAGRPLWKPLAEYDDQVGRVAVFGDYAYLLSTKAASSGEVIRRRITGETIGAPEQVLAGGELILSELVATRGGVYVKGARDGASSLLYLANGSGAPEALALPFESELMDLTADPDGSSVVFGLQGWTTTTRSFRATGTKITSLELDSANWMPTQSFLATREEATSMDGTRVPMVILRKPGAAGRSVPTIVEGYASYGITTTSPFSFPLLSPWVERGGAFVFCGARGGGERGRAWHESGRAANKPTAQDDFNACARRAHELGVASPATTLAMGSSAGGLLVPGAVLRAPELYAGLMPRVAILNPTRLAAAPNGPNQFAEMGDPSTEDGFNALLIQDSVAALATAKDVPNTLITVGLNDTRVVPWMSAKFAATAAERFGARRSILMRVDASQGHGMGSSRESQIQEFADAFAWGWQQASTSAPQLPE